VWGLLFKVGDLTVRALNLTTEILDAFVHEAFKEQYSEQHEQILYDECLLRYAAKVEADKALHRALVEYETYVGTRPDENKQYDENAMVDVSMKKV